MTPIEDLDLQIQMLTNQLDFAEARRKALKKDGIEVAEIISDAYDVSTMRVVESFGDIYLRFSGESENQNLSFKLSRDLAGELCTLLDDELIKLDRDEETRLTKEAMDKTQITEEDLDSIDITEILRNAFSKFDYRFSPAQNSFPCHPKF